MKRSKFCGDRRDMRSAAIDDGIMQFAKAHPVARADAVLEAAE